jgi:hypothetical protein
MAETVAAVFGGLYLLVGIAGISLAPGGGTLLGVFEVNWFQHAFHGLVGGLGLLAAWRGLGRVYCQVLALVFLALSGAGFAAPSLMALLLAQAGAPMLANNLLHLMSGLGFAYFGFMPAPRAAQASSPVAR